MDGMAAYKHREALGDAVIPYGWNVLLANGRVYGDKEAFKMRCFPQREMPRTSGEHYFVNSVEVERTTRSVWERVCNFLDP